MVRASGEKWGGRRSDSRRGEGVGICVIHLETTTCLSRIAKIKKTNNANSQQRHGTIGEFILCWWEHTATMEHSSAVSFEVSMHLPCNSPMLFPRETKIFVHKKSCKECSQQLFHNSPKLNITIISIKRRIDEHIVVQPYNGVQYSN